MSLSETMQAQGLSMASKMGKDLNLAEAERFLNNNREKGWSETFRLLFSMLGEDGYYLSPSTWAVIAGALAYVVFPLDVIPDFIPGLGWIDDAFVLGTVVAMLDEEIKRYKIFRSSL
ncbi:MAG: DUF1232 domain-containing protein [Candidatus Cloacimonetes bacterium]|nr:DUF1232 domain-containing protein [Candidatus Cloacimonadota bacterium]MDY0172945.1 YkvA family protein [Candidatus Cloacimonadaceae bacterium]